MVNHYSYKGELSTRYNITGTKYIPTIDPKKKLITIPKFAKQIISIPKNEWITLKDKYKK